MSVVRSPAVAGAFYPSDPYELRTSIEAYLALATSLDVTPKALIAPHAGYVCSGPIAGSAYVQINACRDLITRVVLVGPSHRVSVRGLAATGADSFATPLGHVPVDKQAVEALLHFPQVRLDDSAHAPDHCLEVHLPFLQHLLGDFTIVPLLVGDAEPAKVGEPLEAVWGTEETLVVISSDLSHFHDYDTARQLDDGTTRAIEQLDANDIGPIEACGCRAISGLLHVARKLGLRATTIDVRNSGDTAGPKDEVVGYGAYMFA
jgi:AmmeMemoRadiSam system protein B